MKHIIISRTDSIGDVVLTLPLAGFLKSKFPGVIISFIGTRYTLPIISRSGFIDQALIKEDLKGSGVDSNADAIIFAFPDIDVAKWAKKMKIKARIGTSHRWMHFLYANKRVNFSRKRSGLHEAQLNFKLLEGIGIKNIPEKSELPKWYGLEKIDLEKDRPGKKRIILHPKSKGSAREWPLGKYLDLVGNFEENQVRFIITGTKEDGQAIRTQLPELTQKPNVEDLSGSSDLDGLIDLIAGVDGLIAGSTGPLHIAAAFGIPTLGLYPPLKPMDPGRWGPIGKNAGFLTSKENCSECPGGQHCPCMQNIETNSVKDWIENLAKKA
jgi:ADP-heptose:LPS heptosyltransferase